MSFARVIEELPTLTRPQQREAALRLFEMEATGAETCDVAICEHSAAMASRCWMPSKRRTPRNK